MRQVLLLGCEGEQLVATLDPAAGSTGVLLVSGGAEVRAGAHGWQSGLAAALADAGYPVLRFDRRGIGDSSGSDPGFIGSAPDICAAAALLRGQAGVTRVVAIGNCDAATAIGLFGAEAGIARTILLNPWLADRGEDGLPPPAAVGQHYRQRLRDPRFWRSLLTGGVNLRRALRGLRTLVLKPPAVPPLAARLSQALALAPASPAIILAEGDATAIGFRSAWGEPSFAAARARTVPVTLATGSHSFHDVQEALLAACLQALAEDA